MFQHLKLSMEVTTTARTSTSWSSRQRGEPRRTRLRHWLKNGSKFNQMIYIWLNKLNHDSEDLKIAQMGTALLKCTASSARAATVSRKCSRRGRQSRKSLSRSWGAKSSTLMTIRPNSSNRLLRSTLRPVHLKVWGLGYSHKARLLWTIVEYLKAKIKVFQNWLRRW